jgi:hypothetical protein
MVLWRVFIEIKCRRERLEEICDILNTHRCVMAAKPVIEEGERTKGGAPAIIPSPGTIACNALVLHQSEEDDLIRHLEQIRELTESISHFSEKRKALARHVMLTALVGAFAAAGVAFVVEALIVVREHSL